MPIRTRTKVDVEMRADDLRADDLRDMAVFVLMVVARQFDSGAHPSLTGVLCAFHNNINNNNKTNNLSQK